MLKKQCRITLRAQLCLLFVAFFACAFLPVMAQEEENTNANALLARLIAGNERFVTGHLKAKHYQAERAALAGGQHPYAIVLACADSRVPPEILFDESLGRLFVIRAAGHVVDPVILGSIEYAVEHLHVNLLIVLGHDSCGAVKATISGGEFTPNIRSLISSIKPAVDITLAHGADEKHLLEMSIKENVRLQMQKSVLQSELISNEIYHKRLTMIGGVYHLATGRVEIVSADIAVERTEPLAEAGKEEAETAPAAKPAEKHNAKEAEREVKKEAAEPSKAPKAAPKANEEKKPTGKEEKMPKGKAAPEKTKKHVIFDGKTDFMSALLGAYENKQGLMVTKTTLMRDMNDHCFTEDCRSLPAGAIVKLEIPQILSIMGRPQLKVRYKGQSFYISAEKEFLEVLRQ